MTAICCGSGQNIHHTLLLQAGQREARLHPPSAVEEVMRRPGRSSPYRATTTIKTDSIYAVNCFQIKVKLVLFSTGSLFPDDP